MFNISFDFDEKTKKVSNLKVDEIKTKELLEKGSFVSVADNKLQFSADAVKLIDAKVGDRITVNYWTENNQTTFPVIGKSEAFTDSANGNKLTKANTVSFRGDQRTMLLEYGNDFKIVPFKEKIFKLEVLTIDSNDNENVTEAENSLNNFVEGVKIDSVEDDLPF